jgi:hypothetical protein
MWLAGKGVAEFAQLPGAFFGALGLLPVDLDRVGLDLVDQVEHRLLTASEVSPKW